MNRIELGRKLREARELCGISQEEAAAGHWGTEDGNHANRSRQSGGFNVGVVWIGKTVSCAGGPIL